MSETGPAIRNISDTARWAAYHRARETERSDALFRDPFAARLAGERGTQIAASMPDTERQVWAWVTRTVLFDWFITEQIRQGVDLVVNLAAGLDARPYRMALPPGLQWIEVDLPDLFNSKEEILAGETPRCRLERVRFDLADVAARRGLFEQLGRRAQKALVLTEGLLIYLAPDDVAALARDLAAPPSFQRWILDLVSPGLLRMMQQGGGKQLDQAGIPFKFGPPEGPEFFAPAGWKPLEVQSLLKTAARLRRVGFFLRLLARLPASNGRQGRRPWGAVCLLGK